MDRSFDCYANHPADDGQETIYLQHGQQVKTDAMDWVDRVTVGTIAGYCKEKGEEEETTMMIARALALGHDLAWTMAAGIMITADYPGKAEKLAREKSDFEAAQIRSERKAHKATKGDQE